MFKTTLGVSLLILTAFNPSAFVFAADNGKVASQDVAVGSLRANQGQVLCTAAINSDGTVAGGLNVKKADTVKLATGQYQVAFGGTCGNNVTAANGYARWVSVDTLQTGTTGPKYCTLADRAGAANAVWVECFDNTGADADTSFYLFVAR